MSRLIHNILEQLNKLYYSDRITKYNFKFKPLLNVHIPYANISIPSNSKIAVYFEFETNYVTDITNLKNAARDFHLLLIDHGLNIKEFTSDILIPDLESELLRMKFIICIHYD